jgi:nucleoside-diphosphate-sugar epimerase
MKKYAVIGGAGFVGSWVVKLLLEDPDNEVFVIDNLMSSEKWNLQENERLHTIWGSASDLSVLTTINVGLTGIFQLACFHGNQSSINNPLLDLENSLKPTVAVLEWAKKFHPNARVLYSGAGCAVAEKTWDSPVPVKEVDVTSLHHDSPYSISKITGEMYCIYYEKQENLDVVRVRFQNAYGPGEILGAGQWRGTPHTIWRNVVPTFIWKTLQGEDLTIYGDGSAGRDFVYVKDLAKGVIKAFEHGKSGEVYNLASGVETSIKSLAETVIKSIGSTSKINFEPRRDWDNSGRRVGDPNKSSKSIDFNAQVQIQEGIVETVEWFKSNRARIEASIFRHNQFL